MSEKSEPETGVTLVSGLDPDVTKCRGPLYPMGNALSGTSPARSVSDCLILI